MSTPTFFFANWFPRWKTIKVGEKVPVAQGIAM